MFRPCIVHFLQLCNVPSFHILDRLSYYGVKVIDWLTNGWTQIYKWTNRSYKDWTYKCITMWTIFCDPLTSVRPSRAASLTFYITQVILGLEWKLFAVLIAACHGSLGPFRGFLFVDFMLACFQPNGLSTNLTDSLTINRCPFPVLGHQPHLLILNPYQVNYLHNILVFFTVDRVFDNNVRFDVMCNGKELPHWISKF